MVYKASLDTVAKVITAGVTILFACLILSSTIDDSRSDASIYIPAILLIAYIGAWFYSPLKYAITGNSIVIYRPIGSITLPRTSILKAEIQPKGFPFAIRTFGVGGLFGYFGSFYNFDSGNMKWYVTNRNNTIVITTKHGKKIVISPDEKEAFVNDLLQ